MPGVTLQTSGFILEKALPADRFQPVALFTAEHGLLRCYQRLSSRQPVATIDLFDEIAASLQSSNQGQTWFFTEVRVVRRFNGIGLSFAALREASAFALLLARNPIEDDARPGVAALLGTALQAWNAGARADIVALKSLYTFARDEGYPVKEAWAAGLRGSDRTLARTLLNEPLAATADVDPEAAGRLLENLRRYLRGHHELILA